MKSGKSQESKKKCCFIVIKIIRKSGRQYLFRRVNKSLTHDTSFSDYEMAERYAANFENSHVILEEDFQHMMGSLDLIARTAKAKDLSLCHLLK
jgi:hypothetical protein